MNSEYYMQQAYEQAMKGKCFTSPNPMVGAVVVKGNKVIASGYHARCGGDHAEVVALKKAGKKSKGSILYVTLEPCAHHGRTPPCIDRIIKSGIAKVVIGMKDPNPLMNGKSVVLLRRAGIQVEVGCLTKELEKLNEAFIKYIQERVPFVTAKIAQTLDGKIATATGESKWITGESTREFARRRRDEYDAIMIGANTVISDDPGLNPHKKNKRLRKIVVDSLLKTSLKAKLFDRVNPSDVIIATTKNAKTSKVKSFLNKGVTVLVAPLAEPSGRVPLSWLMRELGRMEIASLLIEGGGQLIGSALKTGVVDKMSIYMAPKIMGDQEAITSVAGLNMRSVHNLVRLKVIVIKQLGEDFLLEGYVYRDR